jgi:hypothetical protein
MLYCAGERGNRGWGAKGNRGCPVLYLLQKARLLFWRRRQGLPNKIDIFPALEFQDLTGLQFQPPGYRKIDLVDKSSYDSPSISCPLCREFRRFLHGRLLAAQKYSQYKLKSESLRSPLLRSGMA